MSFEIFHPNGRSFRFDATASYSIPTSSTATRYRVDSSANPIDHVTRAPKTLRATVSVTYTPPNGSTGPVGIDRVRAARDFLATCDATPVEVFAPREGISGPWLLTATGYTVTRAGRARFELSFVEWRTLEVQTTTFARVSAPRPASSEAEGEADRGTQSTTDEGAPGPTSFLAAGLDFLGIGGD